MFKVYRIENEDGSGPYTSGDMRGCHNDTNHPSITEDVINGFEYDMVCACESLSKLKRWFTYHHLRKLRNLGYEVVEVTVSGYEATYSNKQIAINPDNILETRIIPYCEKKRKYLVD